VRTQFVSDEIGAGHGRTRATAEVVLSASRIVKQERRKVARSRILKGAKLIVASRSTIDCIVRNVTNDGARIQIANTIELPKSLGLTFDGGERSDGAELSGVQ
jgi:hypothetical protein